MAELDVELNFYTSVYLDYWLGSAFRGSFGRYLKFVCCTAKIPECMCCNDRKDCLFFYIYENTDSARGYSSPVKPIIFIPPFFGRKLMYSNGMHYTLKILMFGKFEKFLPYIVQGLNYLGRRGLGSLRYDNMNRFYVEKINCGFSGNLIYNGDVVEYDKLMPFKINNLLPYKRDELIIGFRTPYIGDDFPLPFHKLLKKIRNRLILFTNQYGNQQKIPNFKTKGRIIDFKRHPHFLKRKSLRSGKQTFRGCTGIIKYELDEIDIVGRWLITVGTILGLGPNSSFGLGFIKQLDQFKFPLEIASTNEIEIVQSV